MEEEKNWTIVENEQGERFRVRVRKLTPRECFRLMDVDEESIDKIQAAGISNSQQYKLAGNSIVVNQLVHLFRQMFAPDRKVGHRQPKQLSLFD